MDSPFAQKFAGLLPELWQHIFDFSASELRALLLLSKSFARLIRKSMQPKTRTRKNLLELLSAAYEDTIPGRNFLLTMGCVGGNGIFYAMIRRPDWDYQLGRWNFAKRRFDLLLYMCRAWKENGFCSADEKFLVVAAGHVVRVDARGRSPEKLFALSVPGLRSMAVDHEGQLLVVERSVMVFSMAGQLLRRLTLLSHPAHVGITSDGLYVVSDPRAHKLVTCRSDGTVLREFSTAKWESYERSFCPRRFAIDGLGRLLVISEFDLLVFSRELEFVGQLASNFVGPATHVDFSDTGRIYLISSGYFAIV